MKKPIKDSGFFVRETKLPRASDSDPEILVIRFPLDLADTDGKLNDIMLKKLAQEVCNDLAILDPRLLRMIKNLLPS